MSRGETAAHFGLASCSASAKDIGASDTAAKNGLILGMGIDLCMIPRIGQVLERHGESFLARVYTPAERAYVDTLRDPARLGGYAKRWAAKEACAKALGTGFAQGVKFQDIEVRRNESGAPQLCLAGAALERLQALAAPGHEAQLFLSMSDDAPFALAQVLIQQVLKSPENC